MNFSRGIRMVLASLLLAGTALALAGCAGPEAQNDSPRPWNSPEGWQNGSLPSTITQPR